MFGRYLHEILGVPVGLIDNAWGGSAAEAWIRRDTIEKDPRFALLMENTVKHEAELRIGQSQDRLRSGRWRNGSRTWRKPRPQGKPLPRAAASPEGWLNGNARPGNIFAGVVNPTLGYGMKGVIWYQGETNAGRAYEYARAVPLHDRAMAQGMEAGRFPFLLGAARELPCAEKPEPGDSTWAELRESQTKTMKLPNTGQAVIIDLGEGHDIHPKNKHDVAARLVRWALVKDYGLKFPYHSPEFKSMRDRRQQGHRHDRLLSAAACGRSMWMKRRASPFAARTRSGTGPRRAIVGQDKVEVSSDQVAKPIAVRYAWADNPVCNLFSKDGLPVTPFRTDDFEMITKPR